MTKVLYVAAFVVAGSAVQADGLSDPVVEPVVEVEVVTEEVAAQASSLGAETFVLLASLIVLGVAGAN